jgi:hypothetical protein
MKKTHRRLKEDPQKEHSKGRSLVSWKGQVSPRRLMPEFKQGVKKEQHTASDMASKVVYSLETRLAQSTLERGS